MNSFNIFVGDWEPAPSTLAPGVVVCAIGDVHGYLGHLKALVDWVVANVFSAPAKTRHLVLLGDYVDRGPASLACLDYVDGLALPNVEITCLLGNHEEYLDWFLDGDSCGIDFIDFWMNNGGAATLSDLGVDREQFYRRGVTAVREETRRTRGEAVIDAISRLSISHRIGGYLFVHAGIQPDVPFADADVDEFTLIREPFLTGEGWVHDFAVVHGHSIRGPDIKPHRISVDSGVYMTGVLTCVELRGDQARFIVATRNSDLETLDKVPDRRSLAVENWALAGAGS